MGNETWLIDDFVLPWQSECRSANDIANLLQHVLPYVDS